MRRATFVFVVAGLASLFSACIKESGHGKPSEREPLDTCREDCGHLKFAVDNRIGTDFYSMPFPMDVRTVGGFPDYTGYPDGAKGAYEQIRRLIAVAKRRKGASVLSAVYFGSTSEMNGRNSKDVFAPHPGSDVLIVDVTADVPDSVRLVPAVADAFSGRERDLPSSVLAVAPAPGNVLKPRHTYAYLVKRSLGDARGRRLAVAPHLTDLIEGRLPAGRFGVPARDSFAPLWPVLERLGIRKSDLAGISVITTGDAVAETAALTDSVLQKYDSTLKTLATAPIDGVRYDRFCTYHGTVEMPQFQSGMPPYDTEGYILPDERGQIASTRTEMVPISISLPRQTTPQGGFPTMIYLHGSGGNFTQAVNRGAKTAAGEPEAGKGPAFVMARHGFATIGVALPMNVDRAPNAGKRGYLNLKNLSAYTGTFLQGIIEQRLLIELLGTLKLDPSLARECRGLSITSPTLFDTSRVHVLGQSHGSAYAYFMGAVEPRVKGVVLTGAGGHWSLLMDYLNLENILGIALFRSFSMHNHLHPTARLLQDAWEPAEAAVYAPRIVRDPLPGHPVRSVFLPAGQGDPEFPEPIFDAMAAALGAGQAGPQVWPGMQESLARVGAAGTLPLPTSLNVQRPSGERLTNVVVQYAKDGKTNMHHIFSEWAGVKHQYGCFLTTLYTKNEGKLVEGKSEDSACE